MCVVENELFHVFSGVPDKLCQCIPVGAVSGCAQAAGGPAGGVPSCAQRLPPHYYGAKHEPPDLVSHTGHN